MFHNTITQIPIFKPDPFMENPFGLASRTSINEPSV